jgi:hypothetical protein
LRALSLCACCRHYPGAATGRRSRSSHPAVTAFPDNVVGSACTSSFSRPAQRSLALRPAHSRGHLYVTCYTEGFSHFVTSMTAPVASGWSDLAGWGLHPLESAALSRRTRKADIRKSPVDVEESCRPMGQTPLLPRAGADPTILEIIHRDRSRNDHVESRSAKPGSRATRRMAEGCAAGTRPYGNLRITIANPVLCV